MLQISTTSWDALKRAPTRIWDDRDSDVAGYVFSRGKTATSRKMGRKIKKGKTASSRSFTRELVYHNLNALQVLFSGSFYAAWASRATLALDSGEPEWSVYSGALGRKFLRLDQFLKSSGAKEEENVPNPKLFPW